MFQSILVPKFVLCSHELQQTASRVIGAAALAGRDQILPGTHPPPLESNASNRNTRMSHVEEPSAYTHGALRVSTRNCSHPRVRPTNGGAAGSHPNFAAKKMDQTRRTTIYLLARPFTTPIGSIEIAGEADAPRTHFRSIRCGTKKRWLSVMGTPEVDQSGGRHNPRGDKPDEEAIAKKKALAERTRSLAAIEGVFLRDRSLRFAVLMGSRLYAADLVHADLIGANLTEAKLIGANLYGVNLHNAHLSLANLTDADWTIANLSEADLRTHEDLTHANLSTATCAAPI